MNPLTNMKNVKKLSEQELRNGSKSSWHDQYKGSAWIFIGGLPYDLTEGDVICVFSQYGEIVNINLIRDKATGKQKGFCFLCYEDQRSTILAVDNFNGIKILGRTIRVDHVADYKAPKDSKNITAETAALYEKGCAVTPVASVAAIKQEPHSPERVKPQTSSSNYPDVKVKLEKNIKKEKLENYKKECNKSKEEKKRKKPLKLRLKDPKKKSKKSRNYSSSSSSSQSDSSSGSSSISSD